MVKTINQNHTVTSPPYCNIYNGSKWMNCFPLDGFITSLPYPTNGFNRLFAQFPRSFEMRPIRNEHDRLFGSLRHGHGCEKVQGFDWGFPGMCWPTEAAETHWRTLNDDDNKKIAPKSIETIFQAMRTERARQYSAGERKDKFAPPPREDAY